MLHLDSRAKKKKKKKVSSKDAEDAPLTSQPSLMSTQCFFHMGTGIFVNYST